MSVDLEELGRKAREVEPAWDDLREQRVLESLRQAPSEPSAPWRPWVALAMAALALIGVGVGLYASGVFAPTPPVAQRPTTPPQALPEPGDGSEMVLADGSTVLLGADARVLLVRQATDRVLLEQERGRAVYRVSSVPTRAFEVRTEAAVVRVRGTAFAVEVDAAGTRVEVQEGRVEVEARSGDARHALLGAGDALSVAVGAAEAAPAAPTEPAAALGSPPAPARAERPEPAPAAPERAEPSADELLERADEARRAGEPGAAAEALGAFLEHHASDGRAASAAFTLGRVENRRGRYGGAARAFARSRRLAPAGPLAEDALAQEALAWSAAGEDGRARAAAVRYGQAHPQGLHRARLERLLSEP